MLKPGRYDLLIYSQHSGQSPFDEWISDLDPGIRQRILGRVARLKKGQFGDYKKINPQLYELRLFFGPGYRVYFGERHGTILVILTGGDKSSQNRDIKRAKEYWRSYLEENP
ncbi:MAG: type II toxin-antitoxin system RelE/ParE family toxin [Methylacidiphilales bacterium]|nr:type II toxin-antitoxin system RelE/ParE family toxin [Candidatus Methylacidiphilales bacterium]